MKRILFALAAAALLGPEARAGSLDGVTLPDSVEVAAKTLRLNGMGTRLATIFNVKVYVLGLYLEKPSHDAAAIASSEETKRLHMHFVRDVEAGKLTEAFTEAFTRNGALPRLHAELDRLNGYIAPMKVGDTVVLTYVPGRGTEIVIKGASKGVIEGADFAHTLWNVWLGAYPPNPEIKAGIVGKG
jgi:hypothetical protein